MGREETLSQLHVLRLDTLPKYNRGILAAQFDELIRQIADDLDNRPGEKKPRKVKLEIAFTPIADDGELDGVNVETQVTGTMPGFTTTRHTLLARPGGFEFDPNRATAARASRTTPEFHVMDDDG